VTPDQFNAFLAGYRAESVRKILDKDFADMLGVSPDTFTRLKQRGAPQHSKIFLLALSAIHHKIEPYVEDE